MEKVTYVQHEGPQPGAQISKLLKVAFAVTLIVPLLIVILGSVPNSKTVPPYPDRFVGPDGETIATKAQIMAGQHQFQQKGLMDLGTIWGHGALRGQDFSAQSLHIMGQEIRAYLSQERYSKPYADLNPEESAIVDTLTILDIKTNTYDTDTKNIQLSAAKVAAFRAISDYWNQTFSKGDLPNNVLPDTITNETDRRNLATFFFWTGWASGTTRPGTDASYTNNWPPDRSVGNVAPEGAIFWSFGGILSLMIVLGIVVYIVHRYRFFMTETTLVEMSNKIADAPVTRSQFKARKFFALVMGLFVAQTLLGGLLAHYTVEPGHFYFGIAKWFSFNWAKTWHLQLGILWIAIAWIASALYVAPLLGGREPRKQGLLVDILFFAVAIVGVGSLLGEVAGIKGWLSESNWFWLGHQGWEYLELGRLWQILLFVGLLGWVWLAYRAIKPRLREEADRAGLYHFYLLAALLIVIFFGFGLLYTPNTHISIADYWRWFVVHIWVEGIFEFFAVATAALVFVMLGLVTKESALRAAYLTAALAFLAGIIGMSHHFFWFGQSNIWIALGSVFSSLEPIPLIMLASRAWMEYKSIDDAGIDYPYRWPLMFLIASSFWNFLGGGVFGFIINLPIINYYEHATYLTSNHAHTALFGTYGMLAIALCAFVWRGLIKGDKWNPKWLIVSFWGLNIGLFLMFTTSLLPVGIMQFIASYREGMWFAKGTAFFGSPAVRTLGTYRLVSDLVLIVLGALPLAWFFITGVKDLKTPTVGDGEEIFPEASEATES